MPPPRTDSSKCRVRQYTEKLLSIQGAKYRTNTDSRSKQSPTKSCNTTNDQILAPIPEERQSLIENQQILDTLADFKTRNTENQQILDTLTDLKTRNENLRNENQQILNTLMNAKAKDMENLQTLDPVMDVKTRNENLRSEFFKDLMQNQDQQENLVKISGDFRKGHFLRSEDPVYEQNNYSSLPRSQSSQTNSDYGSLKRKKQLISASLTSLLENKQSAIAAAASAVDQSASRITKQLTPPNPLSRTPSRSRSNSPMTFTSCVKVQYKPKMVNNLQQPLYGQNQFQDLSRSKSATAIMSYQNYSNTGIFHASPFDNTQSIDKSHGSDKEINTEPPPRPPLPKNYESPYFLSLPRDWHNDLTRSSSYSAMLC